MTRVHFVKRAQKDYPEHGIKKGESYWWWKFKPRRGDGIKRYSKTQPKPSQLTQSEYLSAAYSLQERIDDMKIESGDLQAVADELRSVAEEIRQLGEEQGSKSDNMPEGLQESETAQLLRSRNEACDALADEIEGAADEIEGLEGEAEDEIEDEIEDEAVDEAVDEMVGRAQDILGGIGWNWE